VNFKHVIARLYGGPHAADPVAVIVTLRSCPTGDGTTTGAVLIAGGASYGG
jgi:hypothetical protein